MGPHAHDPDEISPAGIPDNIARIASPAMVIPTVVELWETAWEAQDFPVAMGSLISSLTRADAGKALAKRPPIRVIGALDSAWEVVDRHWMERMASFGYLTESRNTIRRIARLEYLDVMREVSKRMGPAPLPPL